MKWQQMFEFSLFFAWLFGSIDTQLSVTKEEKTFFPFSLSLFCCCYSPLQLASQSSLAAVAVVVLVITMIFHQFSPPSHSRFSLARDIENSHRAYCIDQRD
jgi:hypothetical protein